MGSRRHDEARAASHPTDAASLSQGVVEASTAVVFVGSSHVSTLQRMQWVVIVCGFPAVCTSTAREPTAHTIATWDRAIKIGFRKRPL